MWATKENEEDSSSANEFSSVGASESHPCGFIFLASG